MATPLLRTSDINASKVSDFERYLEQIIAYLDGDEVVFPKDR